MLAIDVASQRQASEDASEEECECHECGSKASRVGGPGRGIKQRGACSYAAHSRDEKHEQQAEMDHVPAVELAAQPVHASENNEETSMTNVLNGTRINAEKLTDFLVGVDSARQGECEESRADDHGGCDEHGTSEEMWCRTSMSAQSAVGVDEIVLFSALGAGPSVATFDGDGHFEEVRGEWRGGVCGVRVVGARGGMCGGKADCNM